ncbi:hypothetical protein C1O66_14970 [Paucibacter aquatile]|uniref:DUF4124 domain-containing protein n=1 Tax=Kinneretia aquatilis TaxID=2070761 RepID=A0A2N8KZ09_9BURK|nr:DUF4124 domain-containing protein [Paucibacter aquatile]PND38698.1 hypothetical protein C1O66_14970 [Paucibacter aquatile]
MTKKKTLRGLALVLSVLAGVSQAGEIWKCQQDGQVRYSDRPCPAQGDTLSPRVLQPNVVAAERAASGAAAPRLVGNVCPDDIEIAAMETRATTSSLGPAEQRFLKDEIGRARQCRQGSARYSAADWALSRQAQSDQFRPGAEPAARQRAEAMHQAAARVGGLRPEPPMAGASAPRRSSP